MRTKQLVIAIAIAILGLAACGGETSGDSNSSSEAGVDTGESGETSTVSADVVNPQPPGHAYASVDGQEFTFDKPSPSSCVIEPDRLTFGFLLTEEGADLAGGANRSDGTWVGDIAMRTNAEDGFSGRYYPDEGAMDTGIAIDGDSMSFTGPMLKQPRNDGTNPPPVPVGEGTISVTCP